MEYIPIRAIVFVRISFSHMFKVLYCDIEIHGITRQVSLPISVIERLGLCAFSYSLLLLE
jgi:hypothetical protein